MARSEWTNDELYECIKAYMRMLEFERNGQSYSKTEFRRELLSGPLSERTNGSIEFRMANISAFRESRSLDWIDGYKARTHIGKNMEDRFAELFDLYESELDESASGKSERSVTETDQELTQEELQRGVLVAPILGKASKFAEERGTQRGPPPRTSGYEVQPVDKSKSLGAVYIAQYGDTHLYKFGYSQDIPERIVKLNEHIPTDNEIPGHQRWQIVYHSSTLSSDDAFAREGEIRADIEPYWTDVGERFICASIVLEKITDKYNLIRVQANLIV